jgi:uncharacterized protein YecE (DUF72 family)
MTIRVGLSGWNYKGWRGKFYTKGLPQRSELAFAAQRYGAIEINGSFYSLQRPESFARWYQETPPWFVFAVKGPRFITHMLKLRGARTPLANFLASGILRLEEKLGPVLWQLPPFLRYDEQRLEEFFQLLPRDTTAALRLARRHDARMRGRSWLRTGAERPVRHAVEVRHDSFRSPDFIRQLRRHRIGLVVADTVEWPLLMDVTADFVYCRLHGSEQLYVSGYDQPALKQWAARVRAWSRGSEPRDAVRVLPRSGGRARGRDVFVFFDNDAKVRAPVDAAALQKLLKCKPGSKGRPRTGHGSGKRAVA